MSILTALLAAAFWLIVTVHGVERERIGPLTGSDCVLQMAFKMLQMERTSDDFEIECRLGERGT